jgi:hypothetical protein
VLRQHIQHGERALQHLNGRRLRGNGFHG